MLIAEENNIKTSSTFHRWTFIRCSKWNELQTSYFREKASYLNTVECLKKLKVALLLL